MVFAGEPLFSVYTNLGPYSPQDRAAHIADRLRQLSADPLAGIDAIAAFDRRQRSDVEIMSPHYAQIRDGNKTTIPEDYLPKTYTQPAFRITPLPMNSPSPGPSPQKGRVESVGAAGQRDELLPRVDKD